MATQGLVTLYRGGEVLMKVVAGCNGQKAREVAEILRNSWPVTASAEIAYERARRASFGDRECLVVMTPSEILYKGKDEISPLYRETFTKPKFNPRWKQGTAPCIVVINV